MVRPQDDIVVTGPDPRRWRALVLLCVAFFMVILDAQIVILALPSIEADLEMSPNAGQWVMSAYLLSFGGLLLLAGRSADLLGRRRMFMVGTALFLVSSLGCGLAWSGGALTAMRVVQGVSKALGVWSAVGGIGATAALLIGGPLTDGPGWRWIFFINIPVALAMLALSPRLLRESREQTKDRIYDVTGAVTITAALVLLVYAVVRTPDFGWLAPQTTAVLAASVLLIGAFVLVEQRSSSPIVPLRIFRSAPLVGGNLALLVLGMGAWGMSLTLSSYAQQVLGYSAVEFGLGTAVMTVGAVVGSMAGQALVTRVGPSVIGGAGFLFIAAGMIVLTQVAADGSFLHDILIGLLLFGPGLGATYVAASVATLAGVDERQTGLAAGLNNAAFQIGGAFGSAVVTTVAVSTSDGRLSPTGLTEGFQSAFASAITFPVLGFLCVVLLLTRRRASSHRAQPPPSEPADRQSARLSRPAPTRRQ